LGESNWVTVTSITNSFQSEPLKRLSGGGNRLCEIEKGDVGQMIAFAAKASGTSCSHGKVQILVHARTTLAAVISLLTR
jgi:hypothetical protein